MANSGLIFIYLVLLSAQTCWSFKSSALFKLVISGHRLTGNIIRELNTLNLLECSLHCIREPSECKSINYRATTRQDYSLNCQLINATKTTHPQNLVADENYDNYEMKTETKTENKGKHYAKSCHDLYKSGKTTTGVYTIDPDGQGAFDVRCDMETTPGRGWAVFQRRVDGSVDFYKNWTDYENGFGNLSGEFWLGLHNIHRMSASGKNVLRVDLQTYEYATSYAVYKSFSVGDESEAYILNIGNYSGTAGDSLSFHNGMKFSTKDVDNDRDSSNCAQEYHGAWWFNYCLQAHLNGEYLGAHDYQKQQEQGLFWLHFKGYESYKVTEMKVGRDQK